METPAGHSDPDTLLAAVSEPSGADAATTVANQIGANLASLDVAAADAVRADISLLGLDRLLELPLGNGAGSQNSAALSGDSFPSFDDDDLPAPLFHDDDLPAPLFHDDDLPAPSFQNDDLPADLTTASLSQILGLQLSGVDPPTVGEVVRLAFRAGNSSETETEEPNDSENDNEQPETEVQESNPAAAEAGDLSFIDAQPLTEQAENENSKVAQDDELDAELLGLELFSTNGSGGSDDPFDLGETMPPPAESGGGGSGGGGNNVINGTVGDDILNGTAGTDIIHGFAGNDIIDGAGGSDRLDGGLGDDVLVWDAADASIDGKNGTDTLRIDGGDADLTIFGGSLSGIEVVDLQTDGGVNALTLTAQNVLDMTDAGDTLTITGNIGDILDASTGWTDGGVVGGDHIYTQAVGPNTATLIVDLNVTVNLNILI